MTSPGHPIHSTAQRSTRQLPSEEGNCINPEKGESVEPNKLGIGFEILGGRSGKQAKIKFNHNPEIMRDSHYKG